MTLRNTLRLAGGATTRRLFFVLGPSLSGPLTAAAQDAAPDEAAAYARSTRRARAPTRPRRSRPPRPISTSTRAASTPTPSRSGRTRRALTQLDAAIKDKRTADMITIGKEILAADPENLNVIYALAFNIRRNELSGVAARLHERGRGRRARQQGDRAHRGGQDADRRRELRQGRDARLDDADPRDRTRPRRATRAEAIKLYEKSTALRAERPARRAATCSRVVALRQGKYGEAAKAYNALPDADKHRRRAQARGEGREGRAQQRGRRAHRRRRRLRRLRPQQGPAGQRRWTASTSCSRRSTRAASPRTRRSTASRRSWRRRARPSA